MDSSNKASRPAILKPVEKLFSNSPKEEATINALAWLASFYERPMSKETFVAYLSVLEELSPYQLQVAFSQAARDCKFFPPASELLALAGYETAHHRSERIAREGLQWILEKIRKHGKNLAPINGNLIREGYYEEPSKDERGRLRPPIGHPAEYEKIPCPPPSREICRTVEAIGNGDKEDGMWQLYEHPAFFKRTDGAFDSPGLRQAAIDRWEKRWLKAWEMANREEGTAIDLAE
jgi:hypothetical protein